MSSIMEQPKPLNFSEDWTYQFQCGCTVTWLASCFHRSTRMLCCASHNGRDQFDERTELRRKAGIEYDFAIIKQPPV
jgi:hypothetical protein